MRHTSDHRSKLNGNLIEQARAALQGDRVSEINRRLMQTILKVATREGDLTRPDIEEMADTPSSVATDWFKKGAVPDPATIAKLARGLHVNAHWLLTGEEPQSLPGEGKETADEIFAMGARAVIKDVRELVPELVRIIETRFSTSRLTHQEAIRRAEEALAAARRVDRQAVRTPGRRRRTRKRQGAPRSHRE